jgi:hypothetical protein
MTFTVNIQSFYLKFTNAPDCGFTRNYMLGCAFAYPFVRSATCVLLTLFVMEVGFRRADVETKPPEAAFAKSKGGERSGKRFHIVMGSGV